MLTRTLMALKSYQRRKEEEALGQTLQVKTRKQGGLKKIVRVQRSRDSGKNITCKISRRKTIFLKKRRQDY
jgi:hypothetical protein